MDFLNFFRSHFSQDEVQDDDADDENFYDAQSQDLPSSEPSNTSQACKGNFDPFDDQVENMKLSDSEEQLLLDEMSVQLNVELDESVEPSLSSTAWGKRNLALCCLRTRKYNANRAVALYRDFTANRQWIESISGSLDIEDNPRLSDVLQRGLVQVLNATDRKNRPIMLFKLAQYCPQDYTAEDIIQVLFYNVEKLLRAPGSLGEAAQLNGVCIIQDWNDCTLMDFDLKLPQAVYKVFGKKTPMRIGVILIHNMSGFSRAALSIGRQFLNEKLKRRIILLDSVFPEDEYECYDATDDKYGAAYSSTDEICLVNYIPISSIPVEYGGSLHTDKQHSKIR